MSRIIVIIILLISVLSSCTNQSNTNAFVSNKTENNNALDAVQIFYLNKDSTATLEIFRNKAENYILLQTRFNGEILSVAGEGNIDFVDGKLSLDTLFFEKDKEVLILPTYVYGSTYGAVVYFLIYREDFLDTWEIIKVPFDRIEIETDKNNISTIVRYTPDNKTIRYILKDGILVRTIAQ